MGMYKYAFMALRGYLELTLFGIKLSTNEFDFKLWKSEKLDVSWKQIVDEEKVLFSKIKSSLSSSVRIKNSLMFFNLLCIFLVHLLNNQCYLQCNPQNLLMHFFY